MHNVSVNMHKSLGLYFFITKLESVDFSSGMYYKHLTIVNDDSRVITK